MQNKKNFKQLQKKHRKQENIFWLALEVERKIEPIILKYDLFLHDNDHSISASYYLQKGETLQKAQQILEDIDEALNLFNLEAKDRGNYIEYSGLYNRYSPVTILFFVNKHSSMCIGNRVKKLVEVTEYDCMY